MTRTINHLIKQKESLNYNYISSPIGKILLIADTRSIKAIQFANNMKIVEDLLIEINQKSTVEMEKLIKYLSLYFNHDKAFKSFKFSIVSDSKNQLNKSPVKEINLDCSHFTDSELSVYKSLLAVKNGNYISYGDLAESAGFSNGARFIGNTMAKNSFPIVIPCHRVIKGDRSIGNYGGGVEKKIYLLEHEGVLEGLKITPTQ